MNKKQWLSASFLTLISSIALASGGSPAPAPAPAAPVDPNTVTKTYSGYEWQRHALDIERDLDKNSPLAQAVFLGTHNAYNSSAYADVTRYLDPNQSVSLYSQMAMGARFIELDVHYTTKFDTHGSPWAWEWTSNDQLLLCHGQSNHTGCSIADRYFKDGLNEVKSFIESNRDEVIYLYIEDHMDGQYDRASTIINDTIGAYVYRPTTVGSGCQNLPMDLTKQQILNAGKNIIIKGTCSSNANYQSWGWDVGQNTRTVANAASCDGVSRSAFDAGWVRFYEDRTTLSAWFGDPGAQITTGNIAQIMKCGTNVIGLDKLEEGDGRLAASIWSWATNEPNNAGGVEDCAASRSDGRFNDANCNNSYRYACHQPGTHNWVVTNTSGAWVGGSAACISQTGGAYVFAAPANAFEASQLQAVKGSATAWINLHDRNTEDKWEYGTGMGAKELAGSWTSSGGRNATAAGNPKFTLSVAASSSATIDLESSVDTYLYLLNSGGAVIATNDDGGAGYNSRLTQTLAAGHYTVVAATYSTNQSGSFVVKTTAGLLSAQ